MNYLKHLNNTHSGIVSLFSMGKSFEGRDLLGLKFSKDGKNKSSLFIDAGIHAREWISHTTALYFIKELAENESNYYLFENINIFIVPVLNPDGYEFTRAKKRVRKHFIICLE